MNNVLDNILGRIEAAQKNNRRLLLVIDGKWGSGKTTLSERLCERYGCSVFHIDDFYLPIIMQTPEVMKEPGGNIDFDRFLSEVIKPLESGDAVAYRPFVCRNQAYADTKLMPAEKINIIEGTYSCHQRLRGAYERLCGHEAATGSMKLIRIFLDVDDKTQIERIRTRVGEQRLKMFEEKWIPREEEYFKVCSVREYCEK